jgi:predicted Zn-dependent protease
MAILTKDEAFALLKKVLSYSKADECEVNLTGTNTSNVRYARNAVSTSGTVNSTSLIVSSAFGKKLGIATINEYDDASLEKVGSSGRRTRATRTENPEYVRSSDHNLQ